MATSMADLIVAHWYGRAELPLVPVHEGAYRELCGLFGPPDAVEPERWVSDFGIAIDLDGVDRADVRAVRARVAEACERAGA